MRRIPTALCALMLTATATGCAFYRPDSDFQQAYRAHALEPEPVAAGEVTVQWFGVSTLLFDAGDHSVLIDGYFSRPGIWRTMFDNLEPNKRLVADTLDKQVKASPVAAVFAAHAHHDHALDAPALARLERAPLHGSGSVLNLARGYGVKEKWLQLLRPNLPRVVGGFTVTAFLTPHGDSPFPLEPIGQAYPLPMHALGYTAGENYSFLLQRGDLSALVVTSPGYEPVTGGDAFGDARAGVVFLAIGTLGKRSERFICEFWEASVRQRGARRVILIHWDAFTRPLKETLRPYGWPIDNADRALRLLKKLADEEPRVAVSFIQPGKRINLTRLAEPAHATVSAPKDCGRSPPRPD